MKVKIKNFDVDMDVRTRGIEFEVRDGTKFLGDVILTQTGIIWCQGRTTRARGVRKSWVEFIEMMAPKSKAKKATAAKPAKAKAAAAK